MGWAERSNRSSLRNVDAELRRQMLKLKDEERQRRERRTEAIGKLRRLARVSYLRKQAQEAKG